MTLEEYRTCVGQLPHGKRLPTAVYVFWEEGADFGKELNHLLAMLAVRHELGVQFNVIKFRTDELKVSFLSYPEFMEEPHPALRHAVTIGLVTGKARHMDYAKNLNPPILHRKEAFLPAVHPRLAEFAALTEEETAVGLYEHTATIGFKLSWEKLLAEKAVRIEGHSLVKVGSGARVGRGEACGGAQQSERPTLCGGREGDPQPSSSGPEVVIQRHKTALMRYELSKPVKTLLEYGLLKPDITFFDYGCGQGSDVRGLQALGHQAKGWDPVHQPDGGKREADIVNLGYVLNVIEDPAERLEALVDAHRHAKQVLVVSG